MIIDCIVSVISISSHCFHFCFSCVFSDPEHQRAQGNLKYFVFQLDKEKKAAEEEIKKGTKQPEKSQETTKRKKKSEKKVAFQLIPERKKYEMLCRGEGNKMVRQTEIQKTSNLT